VAEIKKTAKDKNSQPMKTVARRKDVFSEHRAWLTRAIEVADSPLNKGGSPHPNVHVGAVLVDAKGIEIAAASNRFAAGVDRRRPERYENGDRSLWINCAEQMVLMSALRQHADLRGAKLYVTLDPCAVCAGLIVEAGIKDVFVPVNAKHHYAKLKKKWKNSTDIGSVKLSEGGVRLTAVDTEETEG